jgi:NitT/TauT family transport system substrate-binding protein
VAFATGSAELDYNAKAIVDREAQEFKLFANFGISIEGNTDNTGSFDTNQRLSDRRAKSVADYLVQYHGIDRARIRIRGNAWNNPIASNDTQEGRAQNRRTDFKLLR